MRPYERDNVFARILRGEEPCTKVYEDEFALAFENNRPAAPVHVLVIPKGEYVSAADFVASASADLVVAASGSPAFRRLRRVPIAHDGYLGPAT